MRGGGRGTTSIFAQPLETLTSSVGFVQAFIAFGNRIVGIVLYVVDHELSHKVLVARHQGLIIPSATAHVSSASALALRSRS